MDTSKKLKKAKKYIKTIFGGGGGRVASVQPTNTFLCALTSQSQPNLHITLRNTGLVNLGIWSKHTTSLCQTHFGSLAHHTLHFYFIFSVLATQSRL